MSGSIQVIDIWNNNGVRYYVQFNGLNQPIRKGGKLLVKLIGSIAKQERYYPVGELDWHEIDDILKADMITEIKERFVIPEGQIYVDKILQRIGKAWRQYKNGLKSRYYKPMEKTLEAHCNDIPGGIDRDNWRKLVKHWFSEKGQYMSQCGKEARASQCHIHTSGGKSYANYRADYEDKHGEEMSLVQLYEDVHKRKDGRFIEGTHSEYFLDDVKAKADILAKIDGSKSRTEVENEAYDDVMYGQEPPKRPQGFGFGVAKRNIYGVHGLLRKEGQRSVHKRPMENENVNLTLCALSCKNEGLRRKMKSFMNQLNRIQC